LGGKAGTTLMIENYMGFPRGINGADLAERARQQAVKFGVELLMMQEGVKSTFHDDRIWTDLADGGTMVARANVCATGVEWRRLNLRNEVKLLGRGLYYGDAVGPSSRRFRFKRDSEPQPQRRTWTHSLAIRALRFAGCSRSSRLICLRQHKMRPQWKFA
jgi:hypothetical protein